MTASATLYRRLVLRLHHAADVQTIRIAAEFARLLNVDLHGVFVEDENLQRLASLPFVRELRLPTLEWSPISLGQINAEIEHMAAESRHILAESADALGVTNLFERLRGDPINSIATGIGAADILAIADPGRSFALPSFAHLCEAALAGPAALMLIPAAAGNADGPIVVLARSAADSGLELGARIAAAAKRDLLVLAPEMQPVLDRMAQFDFGRPATRVRTLPAEARQLSTALAECRARLIILSRGALQKKNDLSVAQLATAAGAPLLVIDGKP